MAASKPCSPERECWDRALAAHGLLDQVICPKAKLDRRTSADGPEHGQPVRPNKTCSRGENVNEVTPSSRACVSSALSGGCLGLNSRFDCSIVTVLFRSRKENNVQPPTSQLEATVR